VADEEKTTVTDEIRKVYKQVDSFVEELLEQKKDQFKPSCTKGCAHCCHLLATITLVEGLVLAERILMSGEWEKLLPKLRAMALETQFEGVNRSTYFKKGIPCALLTAEKTCSVYDDRPSCCRYHLVDTPPDHCSHLAPPEVRTRALDLREAEAHIWDISKAVAIELNFEELFVGPLPHVLLHCMATISKDEEHFTILDACEGIDLPMEWMAKHVPTIAKENEEPPERIELK
jgi:Fe-S-cluster containining protein